MLEATRCLPVDAAHAEVFDFEELLEEWFAHESPCCDFIYFSLFSLFCPGIISEELVVFGGNPGFLKRRGQK